jgi:hypothetical protein
MIKKGIVFLLLTNALHAGERQLSERQPETSKVDIENYHFSPISSTDPFSCFSWPSQEKSMEPPPVSDIMTISAIGIYEFSLLYEGIRGLYKFFHRWNKKKWETHVQYLHDLSKPYYGGRYRKEKGYESLYDLPSSYYWEKKRYTRYFGLKNIILDPKLRKLARQAGLNWIGAGIGCYLYLSSFSQTTQ